MHEIPKPESLRHRGGVWFALGDFEIHMATEDVSDRALSRRHVAFQVDDLDAVRNHLIAHGVNRNRTDR